MIQTLRPTITGWLFCFGCEVERWLTYRANRNNTAHDYGEAFANETLALLPDYLTDVRVLASRIQAVFDAQA